MTSHVVIIALASIKQVIVTALFFLSIRVYIIVVQVKVAVIVQNEKTFQNNVKYKYVNHKIGAYNNADNALEFKAIQN